MSRGLGQGELLEPAPTRRLIVPAGHESVWGVDCSSKAVSVGYVAAGGARGVHTVAFPKRQGGERLVEIFAACRGLGVNLCVWGRTPGLVAVEAPAAPKSRPVNPPLYYAVGVIVAGLLSGVRWETGRIPAMEWVVASQWKALACGHGGIRKPPPNSGEPYAVLEWSRTVGYRGFDFNECDAYGIADWARRTFVLEVR